MKKMLYLFSTLIILSLLNACDVIKGPYEEDAVVPAGDRKVLLEDFTGHECGNCPLAGKEAVKLDSIYKGRVIVVATHCSFFADTNATGKFTYNFKTAVGNELDTKFSIETAGLPKGMINRQPKDGNTAIFSNRLSNYGEWSSRISTELTKAPEINIALSKTYDSTTRNLQLEVELEYVKRGNINQQLVLYVVEDSIINWQKWYNHVPEDMPNYVHRHVLRNGITSTWGDSISSKEEVAGKKLNKTYYHTISTRYNQKHCYIVAFVQNNVTKEILQVEEIKLIE